jgi:nucleotide-binding universal stress UspA family protein
MNVMIATDGHINAETAAKFASTLAGEKGTVRVLTVVEVPRRLLQDLRQFYGEKPDVSVDSEYGGPQILEGTPPANWPGDDAMVSRFVSDQRESRTADLARALGDSGLDFQVEAIESEKPARSILDEVRKTRPDVIIVGSHGEGRFEGLLGSTGTKVARLAPCPVLVLREEP